MKSKHIFAINLFGLTVGLTTVILIMLWVKDELSVNRYHTQINQIYSVMTNHDNSAGIVTIPYTPAEMAEAMKAELSQVDKATAISPFIEGVAFEQGDTKMNGDGFFVDQEYFHIFDVDFVVGNPEKALSDINAITISETLANKLFGAHNWL
jgi:hypothetical protein